MQDSDESVAQRAQSLVVKVAGGAVLVVENAGSGAGGQSTECHLVEGVVEASVADVSGQHGTFLAGGDGQG